MSPPQAPPSDLKHSIFVYKYANPKVGGQAALILRPKINQLSELHICSEPLSPEDAAIRLPFAEVSYRKLRVSRRVRIAPIGEHLRAHNDMRVNIHALDPTIGELVALRRYLRSEQPPWRFDCDAISSMNAVHDVVRGQLVRARRRGGSLIHSGRDAPRIA
jgi:hypothetical protein